MTKGILIAVAMAVAPALLYAVDGQILINQATVLAAGGFPYKITQSGSYKLSGNLVVSTEVDAIDIVANNVTLDLNGFTISNVSAEACNGLLPCTFTGVGVSSPSNIAIAVRNGAVSGFGTAVLLQGIVNNRVEELNVSSVNTGLSLVGAVVRRNNVTAVSTGIMCNQCVITENVVFGLGTGFNIFFSFYGSNNLSGGGVSGTYNTSGGNACGLGSC
jgi:hypothetical protein